MAASLDTILEAGGQWERWTIDEIFDDRVRLLICEAQEATRMAAGYQLAAERGAAADATRDEAPPIADTAMAIELAPTIESWTDEQAVFVDRSDLELFLRRRSRAGVLPGRRPVREGDVFWILSRVSLSRLWVDERGSALGAYRHADPLVLDLTAAARQASKRVYHRATQAAPPEPEG